MPRVSTMSTQIRAGDGCGHFPQDETGMSIKGDNAEEWATIFRIVLDIRTKKDLTPRKRRELRYKLGRVVSTFAPQDGHMVDQIVNHLDKTLSI